MLKSYLKTAFRNILRNKFYTAVSVIGLGLGLGVCLLALQYLTYEFSYDNIKDANRVYQVVLRSKMGDLVTWKASNVPELGQMMKSHFADVQSAVSVIPFPVWLPSRSIPKSFSKLKFWAVDPDFFKVFGFGLLKGDVNSCLQQPNSIVLTRGMAMKCFGSTNVVGRALQLYSGGAHDCVVTGVMESIPKHMSFSFDAVGSGGTFDFVKQYRRNGSNWGMFYPYCFIKLKSATDVSMISNGMADFVKSTGGDPGYDLPVLVPMKDVHFRTDISTAFSTYPIKYLYILTGVALLVLLVSVFNFIGMNLTLFSRRLREVGIRKVIGAKGTNLTAQFFVETAISVLASLVIGICFAELLLPVFDTLMDLKLSPIFMISSSSLVFILGLALLLIGFMSFYSTHFFSSSKPHLLIKGRFGESFLRTILKRALIGFQFAIGAFLICCSVVMIDQLNFMRHKDLGFNPKNILVVDAPNSYRDIGVLENEIERDPDIEKVSATDWVPGNPVYGTTGQGEGYKKTITLNEVYVDANFVPLMGLHLIKGRNFDPRLASDSGAAILNQEAIRELSEAGPVGDSVHFFGNNWKIVGVVRDFNFQSLRSDVKPIAMRFLKSSMYLALKVRKGRDKEALAYVRRVWKKVSPSQVFNYFFLQDKINTLYSNEDRMFIALLSGSALAGLIALMGVFALSSFLVETKTKEIAIRKVLGSSVTGVIELLSGSFVKLVILANVIVWPIAFLIMRGWLQNYAYRITIDLFIFPLVGIAMVALTFITVLLMALRTARANPVESLRYE